MRVVEARGCVLSVILETTGVWDGAYRAHDKVGVVCDLQKGRRLTLEDLVEDIASFRQDLKTWVPLYDLPADSCEWAFVGLELHVTHEGLHVTPVFLHVDKACQYANLGRLVPRDLALRHARRNSLLAAALAGRWGP